jgi:hypothetical protein
MLVILPNTAVAIRAISSKFLTNFEALRGYVIILYEILYVTKAINTFFLRRNITLPTLLFCMQSFVDVGKIMVPF